MRWKKRTELNNYELKNSQYNNWEKVMKQYRSSLHKYDKWKSKRILNYSGEFQEVESNYSEGLFYVSSQPAVPFDTWNTSGQQENVFGNQFSTVDSRNHYQGIHLFFHTRYYRTHQVLQDFFYFYKLQAQGPISRTWRLKTEAQFQCRHLQEGRRPWVIYGWYSAEFYGWTTKAANIQIAILPYATIIFM